MFMRFADDFRQDFLTNNVSKKIFFYKSYEASSSFCNVMAILLAGELIISVKITKLNNSL